MKAEMQKVSSLAVSEKDFGWEAVRLGSCKWKIQTTSLSWQHKAPSYAPKEARFGLCSTQERRNHPYGQEPRVHPEPEDNMADEYRQ
jgi:hypothetical protein